jgi:hypothetical protein
MVIKEHGVELRKKYTAVKLKEYPQKKSKIKREHVHLQINSFSYTSMQ